MTLAVIPSVNALGQDSNLQPLSGGVVTGTTDVATMEMEAGSAPGLGVPKVAPAGGTGPGGLIPLGQGRFQVPAVATQIPLPASTKAVLIQNDDGGEPNNTSVGNIWFGTATVAVNSGGLLRPGGSLILDLRADADEQYYISSGGTPYLSWTAYGEG